MIKLHRKKKDPKADELEQELNDLVLAFKTVEHTDDNSELPKLPYIEESDQIIQEVEAIDNWLLELKKELDWQRSLSGDACYIHPETGEIC